VEEEEDAEEDEVLYIPVSVNVQITPRRKLFTEGLIEYKIEE
jgi:hypothetical protein